jgi:hypothetical protein
VLEENALLQSSPVNARSNPTLKLAGPLRTAIPALICRSETYRGRTYLVKLYLQNELFFEILPPMADIAAAPQRAFWGRGSIILVEEMCQQGEDLRGAGHAKGQRGPTSFISN